MSRTLEMPSSTFSNRYEVKYLVRMARIEELKHALLGFFESDRYAQRSNGYYVYSIYFDSPRHDFYVEKREGQLTRLKPRLRFYLDTPDATPNAYFLELKGRYDRIVLKRREEISRELATALLQGDYNSLTPRELESPTLGEFLYLAERNNLVPCVSVLYRREPFNAAFYPGLRLTFDTVIESSFRTELDICASAFQPALPPDWFMLELKYNRKLPRLILQRLNRLGLQQRSVSKYAISLDSCYDTLRPRRYAALDSRQSMYRQLAGSWRQEPKTLTEPA